MKNISYQQRVADKKQFKLWMEPELIGRLTDAGKKFGRGTPQQVVEELIDLYLPLWLTVNTATERTIDKQAQAVVAQGLVTGDLKPTKSNTRKIDKLDGVIGGGREEDRKTGS